MTGVLIERGNLDIYMLCVKVKLPQAKELAEAGREAYNQPFPRILSMSMALKTAGSQNSGFQISETTTNVHYLTPLGLWYINMAPSES